MTKLFGHPGGNLNSIEVFESGVKAISKQSSSDKTFIFIRLVQPLLNRKTYIIEETTCDTCEQIRTDEKNTHNEEERTSKRSGHAMPQIITRPNADVLSTSSSSENG